MAERQEHAAAPPHYDLNVFINCPFDPEYRDLQDAIVFAVSACGLRPRNALEVNNGVQVRIEKIMKIILECRWGIHDLSRVELSTGGLPRFNMPFELGLFLGANRFGDDHQRRKSCLILDSHGQRFRESISDIAGQDIQSHGNSAEGVIRHVRDWLTTERAGIKQKPGADVIAKRFQAFKADLPQICALTQRQPIGLTFVEITDTVVEWLRLDVGRHAG